MAAASTISISSSDEESGSKSEPDSESESEPEYESESEFEADSEEDGSVSDDDDDDSKGKHTDEERCNKVIDLLQGRKNLNMLTLEECKAYLRKHELRIGGTKDTCIKRILEHWRLKDGNGEKLYPKSSFTINCTGDVCRGDVVLFKQKVYEKFDIVKRGGGGKVIGKRIIVGRIVKESYGGAKQQHTFSLEVLWSKGVKVLPPLSPLLVKGRNLYRLKTFRQRWTNEAERSRILAEKHRRGAAARHTRTIAKSMAANLGSKLKRKSSTSNTQPNNKRRRKSEHPPGKKKHNNCAKNSPIVHANMKKTMNTRVSATKAHAKMTRIANTKGKALSRGRADSTRNLESFTTDQPRSSYQRPNGYNGEYTYPHQRDPYNDHNLGAFEVNRGSHPIHIPCYNLGSTSSSMVRMPGSNPIHIPCHNLGTTLSSMVRMPHGHMLYNYNIGSASNAHDQIFNRPSYASHPSENSRFHGWRRP